MNHLGRHVHADDSAGRTDLAGRQEAIDAAAAAKIKHGFTLTKLRERQRSPASKTHVRAFRQAGQLTLAVAEVG